MAMETIYKRALESMSSLDVAGPTATPATSNLSPAAIKGIIAGVLGFLGVLSLIAVALAYKYGCCYPVWEERERRNESGS